MKVINRRILFFAAAFLLVCAFGSGISAQEVPVNKSEEVKSSGNIVTHRTKDDIVAEVEEASSSFWKRFVKPAKKYDPKTDRFYVMEDTVERRIIQTVTILFVGYFLIFLLAWIVNRQVKDVKIRYVVRKNIVYVLNALILLLIIPVWMKNLNHIAVFISVVGAGVALALQEVILCIAGWMLIMVRRPFTTGDRIELGGVKGDVIDIRVFQTSLLEIGNWVDADQSTGRIVNVPNSAVFKKENYNYNQGFEYIWNEIKVLATFESDWKKAEEVMLKHGIEIAGGDEKILKRRIAAMTRKYMIKYGKLTPIVYVDIQGSGVELTLRYLTEARKRRVTKDMISRAILTDFDKEPNVNIAYTTYRIVK
jgi:small-conductance mechanosensitive channel